MKAYLLFAVLCFSAIGCSSVTLDQMRLTETSIDRENEAVVVLSRQHTATFQTEASLVRCVAGELGSGRNGFTVVPQQTFLDALYPWFEPRTAPLNLERLEALVVQDPLRRAVEQFNVRYIIWVEGSTETTESSGGMSCTITPYGGGCLGLGMWHDQGSYEATIWDFKQMQESGRISADSRGTSYMPAVIIPIPMLAMVQTDTCRGLGRQIQGFIEPV
jgi:hypothetical protein